MEWVSIDAVEAAVSGTAIRRSRLSGPLGTSNFAINHYRIPPKEELPAGLHAHADQEEVFVVLAGAVTFETYHPCESEWSDPVPSGEGETAVEAGEAIRFAPGEFQSGRNDGDEPLEILALGAPRDTEDVRLPVTCPECGHETVRLGVDETGATFTCPDCGVERVPEPCLECGADLRMTLADAGRPVAACAECGAVFDRPPVRE